jgi:prepilin-type processing-associated H-X9-DG protein
MFVTGMAAAGVAHQLGWLTTATSPLLEGSGGATSAARRAQSTYNLKQVGLAFRQYHDREGRFPSGCTTEPHGEILHSWMATLLPFLEQQKLFDEIDFALPWNHPKNESVFKKDVSTYRNPAFDETAQSDGHGFRLSHYAGNVHVVGGTRRLTEAQITDGASQTIMAGEVGDRFSPWGRPGNWRDPALGLHRSPDGFGGPFPGGSNFLFGDGSVRFIKNAVDPRVFKALGTPSGGEIVNADTY